MTEPNIEIEQLDKSHIDEIMELEVACWPEGVRASDETYLHRLDIGHILMGAREDGVLMGMTCFSYTQFDPFAPEKLPRTFNEFASVPTTEPYNVGFGYSLNVHPSTRGSRLLLTLLRTGYERMKADGCDYMFGDGRCPSYNGSDAPSEKVKQSPEFKQAVDHYIATGEFPTNEQLIKDPLLRYIYRVMGCEFVAIIPDFFPTDIPAGGFRVMYRRKIV